MCVYTMRQAVVSAGKEVDDVGEEVSVRRLCEGWFLRKHLEEENSWHTRKRRLF